MADRQQLLTVAGLTDEAMKDAAATVKRYLEPTPLLRLHPRGVEVPVWAKLETFQPTGSFKVRGALAAAVAYAGAGSRIVTASAGNHGLGVAYAASLLGVDATIVVPRTASAAKVAALKQFPVDLRLEGANYDEAEGFALDLASTDGQFVSAYNDPHVMAGQGTVVSEISQQLTGEATILVPVGGGGLISGSALASTQHPELVVVGVETAQSRAVSAAMHEERVVRVDVGATIADGLAGNIEASSVAPAVLRAAGVDVVAVEERGIREAVAEFATADGLVVEGSGAVGLAALRAGHVTQERPVVLVVTGRNIAPHLLAEILAAA
jgi:threonine dehydratase